MKLLAITTDLQGAVALSRLGPVLHANEVMYERRVCRDEALRKKLKDNKVHVANGMIYSLQGVDKTPTLTMTKDYHNPLFQDSTIDAYCDQLQKTGNYHPMAGEVQKAFESATICKINLDRLRLSSFELEYGSLVVDTANYRKDMNEEELKLLNEVYGDMYPQYLDRSMKMLREEGFSATRIVVLTPDYVRKEAAEEPIGRASCLHQGSSVFDAANRHPDGNEHVVGMGYVLYGPPHSYVSDVYRG